ncbi:Transposon Tf2-9 poly [Brachionus plicatilis]|uniref:Transposon Tf2-9 poly n=1 Tax=Brachionus plicatilis TaxID=10195 RepID=A0A3M7RD09_BRAPC|nr:Transposon Tf2-9 poly [Brachionus plicatilis]
MSEVGLGYYHVFDCDVDDPLVGTKWTEWLDGLENYLTWLNVADDKRKVAALFHHAGREISRIYKSMPPNELVDNMPRVDKFEDIKKKINDYLNPRKNVFYEIHKFRQAKQECGESIAGYVTRLKNLSTYCGFTNVDNEIISQIIEGSNNRDVVAKALRMNNDKLKLETLLDWGRTREVAGQQIKDIEKDSNEVNAVHDARRETRTGKEHDMSGKQMINERKCFSCGFDYPHKHGRECPAKNQSELMFRRTNFSRLNSLEYESSQSEVIGKAIENDKKALEKVKFYADSKIRFHKVAKFKVGDHVLLRQKRKSKTTSLYERAPYRIVSLNGTMAEIDNGHRQVARNTSVLKKVIIYPRVGMSKDAGAEGEQVENNDSGSDSALQDLGSGEVYEDTEEAVVGNERQVSEGLGSNSHLGETDDKQIVDSTPKRTISKHQSKKSSSTKKRAHRATRKQVNYKETRTYNTRSKSSS